MRTYASIDVHFAYSVVTKCASAISRQMRCSQVLPGYPHISAGAYVVQLRVIILSACYVLMHMYVYVYME